jgi:hypothetical protein
MNRVEALGNRSGQAMVISLLTLGLLTVLGVMLLAKSSTETEIAANDQRATQALYNAEGGIGEALARINAKDSLDYVGPPVTEDRALTRGWGAYIVLDSSAPADDPRYDATLSDGLDNNLDGMADEPGEHYPIILSKQTGTDALSYPWVKLRYKLNRARRIVRFGDHDANRNTPPRQNLVAGAPVLIIEATGTQGTARRRVEVEAVRNPVSPIVPAAWYVAGRNDIEARGRRFEVSGEDWDPITEARVSANGIPGIAHTGGIEVELENGARVKGGGEEPAVIELREEIDLEALVAEYSTLAEHRLPSGTQTEKTYGAGNRYTVVHCPGRLTLEDCTGYGVLVVEGSLRWKGNLNWQGLIIARGGWDWGLGGGNLILYGAMLTGEGEEVEVEQGRFQIRYSNRVMDRLSEVLHPYVVGSWRELSQ